MEIKSFRLRNVGRFSELEVPLAPTAEVAGNVTVFVGNNGAGKTSLLKSLATCMSWLVARIRTEKGNGNQLSEQTILNNKSGAAIDVFLTDDQSSIPGSDAPEEELSYRFTVTKSRTGRKSGLISDFAAATRLADRYRSLLTENDKASLPLIAFYPVERSVLDIPLKIRGKHTFSQLDGYDKSLNQGVDFRRFFEWFREREDVENESSLPSEIIENLLASTRERTEVWEKLQALMASSRDRQLTAVRDAISGFMPGFSNLRVRRKPRLHMSIDKGGETLNVSQLSQGEKSLMALVGDIARRLAMMNPALQNPLHGDGVVLIDEVDMHLHPSWQRNIIRQLTSTFPNCQFVLTTHSPLVISDCDGVLVYSLDDGALTHIPSQYGQDANTVLLSVMDTHIRNETVAEQLSELFSAIQNNELQKSRSLMAELEQELPVNHLELSKAQLLLKKQELRHARN